MGTFEGGGRGALRRGVLRFGAARGVGMSGRLGGYCAGTGRWAGGWRRREGCWTDAEYVLGKRLRDCKGLVQTDGKARYIR